MNWVGMLLNQLHEMLFYKVRNATAKMYLKISSDWRFFFSMHVSAHILSSLHESEKAIHGVFYMFF